MSDVITGPVPQVGVGVVASFDFDRDRELWRWAPAEVTPHISRTEPTTSRDAFGLVSALNQPDVLRRATREVLELGVQAVVYLCTACTFVGGVARERALRQALLDEGAGSAATTSGAVADALHALGARRIAVAHPYIAPVGERLTAFLTESGFEVLASRGLGLQPSRISAVPYARVCELVRAADRPDADAIFVSCTSLASYDVIAPLERELGKPIVTANQATMWRLLRLAGRSAVGPGQRLLEV